MKQDIQGYDPIAAGEQDENGIDLELLRRNLSLSPMERLQQHREWIEQMLMLQGAAEVARRTKNHPVS